MRPGLRKELAFIRKYVAPPKEANPEDIFSPCEVARLFREAAHHDDLEQAGETAEIAEMIARHHRAVVAAWRTAGAPEVMPVRVADAAAVAAAKLDSEDGIDY